MAYATDNPGLPPTPAALMHSAAAGRPAPRFYYGWACVAGAALAMVATLPGRTMGLGLVTEPLLRDLSLSRTTYGSINLWATLLGAGFGLAAGRLVDRVGVRAVSAGTTLLLGLTVLGLARAAGPWGLLLAVTLTRGFGQSALSVASIAVVGKWFDRRVGRATAVYAVLLTIGFMAAIPALEVASQSNGWRPAWTTMGAALVLGVAPLLWAVLRDGPVAAGLTIDGGPAASPGPDAASAPPADAGHTLRQALATPAFWALALGGFLFNAAYSAITLFNESILAERGFDASPTGPLVVMVFAGLASNFLGGWLAGRWRVTRLTSAAMLLLAVALAALPHVRTPGQIMTYAATMGVAAGLVTIVFFAGWGQLFGRRHLGQIQGAAQGLTVLASAVGPMAVAACKDAASTYDPFFLTAAALAAAVGLGAFWIGPVDPAIVGKNPGPQGNDPLPPGR